MMSARKILSAIGSLVMIIFGSCDCPVHERGYVVNAQNGKPISGATVEFHDELYKTDSSGFFKISEVFGFCPDRKFVVSKTDFRTQILTKDFEDGTVIYKINTEGTDSLNNRIRYSSDFKVVHDTLYFSLIPEPAFK